jgi:hypothetical protein
MNTWEFESPYDPEVIPDEWVWERLRIKRDRMLVESDWTQLSDAPVDTQAWAEYRQALRDLPEQVTDPRKAVWPTQPAGNEPEIINN